MKKKVNKKQRKFCFLILEVIILALCLLYLNAKIKYENVFYTGTVINEFDCSKMTVDEARLALEAKKKNIKQALVTCHTDNIASRKVILANGGVLEDVRESTERYWINLAEE